jgi:hypothetical protein
VDPKPLRVVMRSESQDWIGPYRCRSWDLREDPAVRAAEPEGAVRQSIELIALLVDRAVVAAAQEGEVRERGRAALGPVADVMAFAHGETAAR